MFQECFNEVLFCNHVLACISSQLPEQKEDLFLLVSFEFYLVLKSFNEVSRKLKRCLKFLGCFKKVLRVFTGNFTGVSRKLKGCLKLQKCFKEVSRVFLGSFKCVSRKFLMGVSRTFQVRLKEISRDIKGVKVCQGALNGVSRVV